MLDTLPPGADVAKAQSVCQPASRTALQVKRAHLLDVSLPTGICYSFLTYAIHFRDLLQDGDITAPSLASSEAVQELALEVTWYGENKPKMKCFCPQAWPSPPQMLPERG